MRRVVRRMLSLGVGERRVAAAASRFLAPRPVEIGRGFLDEPHALAEQGLKPSDWHEGLPEIGTGSFGSLNMNSASFTLPPRRDGRAAVGTAPPSFRHGRGNYNAERRRPGVTIA